MMKYENYELILLSPSSHLAEQYFPQSNSNQALYSSFIARIGRLRNDVYKKDSTSDQFKTVKKHYGDIDSQAWHVIWKEKDTERLLGCVRILAIERQPDIDPQDILAYSGVVMNDTTLEKQHLSVIQKHIVQIYHEEKQLIYVGGLAVEQKSQRLGHGAILALSAYEFSGIIGDSCGLTFAQHSQGGADFLTRVGGYYLDNELSAFYCHHHKQHVRLIGLEFGYLPKKNLKILDQVKTLFKDIKVISA